MIYLSIYWYICLCRYVRFAKEILQEAELDFAPLFTLWLYSLIKVQVQFQNANLFYFLRYRCFISVLYFRSFISILHYESFAVLSQAGWSGITGEDSQHWGVIFASAPSCLPRWLQIHMKALGKDDTHLCPVIVLSRADAHSDSMF